MTKLLLTNTFFEVLESSTRSPEITPDADIYGWLIGSWNVRVIDSMEDGSRKESRGEWHFARVLEGRAIQDVFIVPTRELRSAATPKTGNRYGTSVRYYEPDKNVWHITWINPVRAVENHLIGRKVENEIIQQMVGSEQRERWNFVDITPNSFRWIGEESTDEGKTWQLSTEFFCQRREGQK
jgi:hypothetical protein